MIDASVPYAELPIGELRAVKRDATGRLLGATIGIGDQDWQLPSLLPGWTRAHVATHIARNADALAQLVLASLAGEERPLYGGDTAEEIERGSERSGLELQIDLDTSAETLYRAFDTVPEGAWKTPVLAMPGFTLTDLVVARIHEVELHHVDLESGCSVDELDDRVAHWLLELETKRRDGRVGHPAWLETESGGRYALGDDPRDVVRGPATGLLAWLTGRETRHAVAAGDVPSPASVS